MAKEAQLPRVLVIHAPDHALRQCLVQVLQKRLAVMGCECLRADARDFDLAKVQTSGDLFSRECAHFFDDLQVASLLKDVKSDYYVLCTEKAPTKSQRQFLPEVWKIEDFETWDMPPLIGFFAHHFDLKLSDGVAAMIEKRAEPEIDSFFQLFKLFDVVCTDRMVTQDIAGRYLSETRQENIFKLRDYLLDDRRDLALALVRDALQRGEAALAMVGLMAKHLRLALLIDTKSTVSLPKALYARYVKWNQQHSLEQKETALRLCGWADHQLKSSRISEELVLTRLVLACL